MLENKEKLKKIATDINGVMKDYSKIFNYFDSYNTELVTKGTSFGGTGETIVYDVIVTTIYFGDFIPLKVETDYRELIKILERPLKDVFTENIIKSSKSFDTDRAFEDALNSKGLEKDEVNGVHPISKQFVREYNNLKQFQKAIKSWFEWK